MSEYAKGYMDGVVDATANSINFDVLKQAAETDVAIYFQQIVEGQVKHAELSLKIEGQSHQYYEHYKTIIQLGNILMESLNQKFHTSESEPQVNYYLLGFNQGLQDGKTNQIDVNSIIINISLLDGKVSPALIKEINKETKNQYFLQGYYIGVLRTASEEAIKSLQEKIIAFKS